MARVVEGFHSFTCRRARLSTNGIVNSLPRTATWRLSQLLAAQSVTPHWANRAQASVELTTSRAVNFDANQWATHRVTIREIVRLRPLLTTWPQSHHYLKLQISGVHVWGSIVLAVNVRTQLPPRHHRTRLRDAKKRINAFMSMTHDTDYFARNRPPEPSARANNTPPNVPLFSRVTLEQPASGLVSQQTGYRSLGSDKSWNGWRQFLRKCSNKTEQELQGGMIG